MDRLSEMLDELIGEPPEQGALVWAERLSIDLPLELETPGIAEGQRVVVTSPPGQAFRTSIMPVFHRLRLTIVASDSTPPDLDQNEGVPDT